MNPTPTPDVEGIALVAIAQVHRVIVVNGLRPLNNSHDTAMAAAIRAYVAACVTHQRVATQAHETMNQHIEQTRQRLDADHAWSPALREKVAQADAHALAARKEWDAMMGTPHADHPHRPVPVNDDMAGADTYTGVLPTGCVIVPVEDEIDSLMDALAPALAPYAIVTDDLDAATRGTEARLRMTVPVHGMAVALAEAQHQLRAVGDTIAQAHALLGRCAVALNHHPTSQALRADVNGWLRRNVP